MRFFPLSVVTASLILAHPSAQADVKVFPLFTDHAVLQRDRPVALWGSASPGESVAVKFQGASVSTTASTTGSWLVELPAMKANGVGQDLVITGQNKIVLHDILIGEVWICSGQSNMGFEMTRVRNAQDEISAARFPEIRQLSVDGGPAQQPATTIKTSGWQPASPATVGHFSAVAYYFARELLTQLKVPIGLIKSTVGGTPVEAWMRAESFTVNPKLRAIRDREMSAPIPRQPKGKTPEKNENKSAPANELTSNEASKFPSVLFNAKIAPLKPYAFRGVIWYQGEANANRIATEYGALFPELINGWRSYFGVGDFPFYWVQLPNFAANHPAGITWAQAREAQTATLALPHTAQAVSIDVGAADNLHPIDKIPVGHRLAVIAESEVYQMAVPHIGPTFVAAKRDGHSLRITFLHAEGLNQHGAENPTLELAGTDRMFHPATAEIQNETLLITSPEVTEPTFVRYAYRNAPTATLYNGAGLPMVPFRNDPDGN